MRSYLTKRPQSGKTNDTYSNRQQIKPDTPQGSVLGPLLLNSFINDFIYVIKNSQVCNSSDDKYIYACDISMENILRPLTGDIDNASEWFKDNRMATNPDRFDVITMGLYI